MNYRHAFHAGNFADVFKHLALLSLLDRFLLKDKPFCYVETHAGRGLYDLQGEAATRTGEAGHGVLRLVGAEGLPRAVADYLELVMALPGNEQGLRWYPGSPLIARARMRDEDRALLAELHPEEAEALREALGRDGRFSVHQRDGYEALKALLPPSPRRGLLLVDPPFEKPDEFQRIFQGLDQVARRWSTATVAVWYPIKRGADMEPVYARFASGQYGPALRAEFCLHRDDTASGLNGTGVIVVRPPWQLDQELGHWLPALGPQLAGRPAFRSGVDWLSPPV